jgi:hypothetical protein
MPFVTSGRLIAAVYALLALVFLVIIGALQPLGVSPDSVSYLTIAARFAQGLGLTSDVGTLTPVVITHWPPFYSIVLGLCSVPFHYDTLQAALYMNALVLAGVVWVANLILQRYTQRPLLLHGFNIFLLAGLLPVYLMVWSETLFILQVLIIVHCIIRYLDTNRILFLAIASILLGLSIVTRYAGLGILGSVLLFFLLSFRTRSIAATISALVCLLVGTVVLVGTWFVFIKQNQAPAEVRPIQFHFLTAKHIEDFLYSVIKWTFPLVKASIGMLMLGLLFVASCFYVPYRRMFDSWKIIFLLVTGVGYLGFIVFSILFFDHITPLDMRILSPVFPIFLLLIFALLAQEATGVWHQRLARIMPVVGILLILLQAAQLFVTSRNFLRDGLEYTATKWLNSEVAAATRERCRDKVIYTNGADIVKLASGQGSVYLPMKIDPISTRVKADYPATIQDIIRRLGPDTVVVYFKDLAWRDYMTDSVELSADTLRSRQLRFKDGFILQ